MKPFNEILAGLESADHLERIELFDADNNATDNANANPIGLIENKPGSQGSLKVYHHLWKQYGAINAEAARAGLELYAEHSIDARTNPGKHPNIDRLLGVIESSSVLNLRCRNKI